jgi:hypothetical protein
MSAKKRVSLAMALLIGVALNVSTPALAEDWAPTPVPLTNTGDEPNASGEATLTGVTLVSAYPVENMSGYDFVEEYSGQLSVTCRGLTPRAVYQIGPIGYGSNKRYQPIPYFFGFKASVDGAGGCSGSVSFTLHYLNMIPLQDGYVFYVNRKNGPHWSNVLTGDIPKP